MRLGFGDKAKEINEMNEKVRQRMGEIRHKIVVMSGKGGVGKSTAAVNLAMAFRWKGFETGILDADIHGPDVPLMLGVEGMRPMVSGSGIIPVFGPLNIKIMSIGFMLEDKNTPIIWRGPLKMSLIRQFLSDVIWGKLDYLIIDLPPGTGDEPLSVMQLISDLDGVVIVTTPQEVALLDSRKAVMMAKTLNVPVLGIVENMSGFLCPNCGVKTDIFGTGGGEKAAKELNVPFLGSLPIDVRIREKSDDGMPFIVANPESAATKAFMDVVEKISKKIEKRKGDA